MSWLLDAQEVTANLDGTFTKTTFPAKKPVRRAQVTQLGVTLDKMLAKLDDEDVQKRAEADAKYKEERDAALAVEDGATEEEIEVAERVVAQMEVDRESENVAMTIERLEREDKVVNTVLAELQRQEREIMRREQYDQYQAAFKKLQVIENPVGAAMRGAYQGDDEPGGGERLDPYRRNAAPGER